MKKIQGIKVYINNAVKEVQVCNLFFGQDNIILIK